MKHAKEPYPASWNEGHARQRRRDHANIEAMQNRIIQRIAEETSVMMPPKVRAFISALQSAHGGGERAGLPFTRAHLTVAQYMQFTGSEVAREARVRRILHGLESYQSKTGFLLFKVERGGDLVNLPDGTQTHSKTKYTDVLKHVADVALIRARDSELWRGDASQGIKPHPGLAMDAQLDWALAQLERVEREADEPTAPMELRKYADTQRGRLESSARRVAAEIDSKGGNGAVWLRTLAKKLLQGAEWTGAEARRDDIEGGVTNLLPCDEDETIETAEESPSMLAAALSNAGAGKPVIPTRADKTPLTLRGFKDATTDERTIREWWLRWPDAGIGIPTGKASGLLVLDIDPRHGGDCSLTELIETHGELPETREVRTGGGGHHIIFTNPQGVEIRNSAGKLGEGIDVRGEGGYIIAPPSLHASGNRYTWLNDHAPAPVPQWLLKLLTEEKRKVAAAPGAHTRSQAKSGATSGDLIAEGRRNDVLFKIGSSMRGKGAEYDEVEAQLLEVNALRCSPALPVDEVLKIARSVMRYAPNGAAVGV